MRKILLKSKRNTILEAWILQIKKRYKPYSLYIDGKTNRRMRAQFQ